MIQFKQIIQTLLVSASILSSAVWAGDEPVNCRNEVTAQQNIYEGTASCTGVFWYSTMENGSLTSKSGEKILQQYIPETTKSSVLLSGIAEIQVVGITGNILNETHYVECVASIPFSHTVDIIKEVCDYTPLAKFYVNQTPNNPAGSNVVSVVSTSTDRDGSVVKYNWWIDGISKGGNLSTLRTSTHFGKHVEIKLQVTDNNGYTDTSSMNVYLKPWSCTGKCELY